MIQVLVVDDLNIIRQAIKTFLARKTDIEIIGFASNGLEAIELIEKLKVKPDIVLMDLLMPVMGGIRATEEICREFSSTKVIIVSDLRNTETASYAVEIGAKGYLLKSKLNSDNLIDAIHSVQNGYVQLDAEIVECSAKNIVHHLDLPKNDMNKKNFSLNGSAFVEEQKSQTEDNQCSVEDLWLETT